MGADVTLWATLTGSSFSFWGLMAASAKLAVYLSSFLAAGLALVLVALPILQERIMRSLVWTMGAAAIFAIAASAWRVMVQAGRLMDDIAFMTDPEIIAISLEGTARHLHSGPANRPCDPPACRIRTFPAHRCGFPWCRICCCIIWPHRARHTRSAMGASCAYHHPSVGCQLFGLALCCRSISCPNQAVILAKPQACRIVLGSRLRSSCPF